MPAPISFVFIMTFKENKPNSLSKQIAAARIRGGLKSIKKEHPDWWYHFKQEYRVESAWCDMVLGVGDDHSFMTLMSRIEFAKEVYHELYAQDINAQRIDDAAVFFENSLLLFEKGCLELHPWTPSAEELVILGVALDVASAVQNQSDRAVMLLAEDISKEKTIKRIKKANAAMLAQTKNLK